MNKYIVINVIYIKFHSKIVKNVIIVYSNIFVILVKKFLINKVFIVINVRNVTKETKKNTITVYYAINVTWQKIKINVKNVGYVMNLKHFIANIVITVFMGI